MSVENILTTHNSYAEVNIQSFRHNIATIKKQSNCSIFAVIKANAYGHGDAELARYAYELEGVTFFGVATIDEAVRIRKSLLFHNIPASEVTILVLGYIPPKKYCLVIEHNISVNIYDENILEPLSKFAKDNNVIINASLEIDTGMKRLGISYENAIEYINRLQNNSENINLFHIMSHFAASDSNEEFTKYQINRFEKIIKNINNEVVTTSLFNTGAIGKYECNQDFVRVGLALYGYSNSLEFNNMLKPVLSLYSKVCKTTILQTGEGIGYDLTFTAPKQMKIGLVPLGYADGIDKRLSTSENYFYIGDKKCRVLGTISMDTTFIDISGVEEKDMEDYNVEIFGEHARVDDAAKRMGTISYEVLCNIKSRVVRSYKEG